MDEPQKVGSSASSSSDNNKEQGEQNLGQDESETGRSNGRAPAATYPAASSSSYRSTPTGQVSNAGALLMAGGNMQLGSVSTRRNTAAGISRPLGTTNGCSSGGPPTETPALSLLSADSGTLARQGHEALFGEKGGGQLQAGPLQKPVVLAGVPTMLKAHVRVPNAVDRSEWLKSQSKRGAGGTKLHGLPRSTHPALAKRGTSSARDPSPDSSTSSVATESSQTSISRVSVMSSPATYVQRPKRQAHDEPEAQRRDSSDIAPGCSGGGGRDKARRPSSSSQTTSSSSRQCGGCGADFTRLRRRHTCRVCHEAVCASCSPARLPAPGSEVHQRVCKRCAGATPPRVISPRKVVAHHAQAVVARRAKRVARAVQRSVGSTTRVLIAGGIINKGASLSPSSGCGTVGGREDLRYEDTNNDDFGGVGSFSARASGIESPSDNMASDDSPSVEFKTPCSISGQAAPWFAADEKDEGSVVTISSGGGLSTTSAPVVLPEEGGEEGHGEEVQGANVEEEEEAEKNLQEGDVVGSGHSDVVDKRENDEGEEALAGGVRESMVKRGDEELAATETAAMGPLTALLHEDKQDENGDETDESAATFASDVCVATIDKQKCGEDITGYSSATDAEDDDSSGATVTVSACLSCRDPLDRPEKNVGQGEPVGGIDNRRNTPVYCKNGDEKTDVAICGTVVVPLTPQSGTAGARAQGGDGRPSETGRTVPPIWDRGDARALATKAPSTIEGTFSSSEPRGTRLPVTSRTSVLGGGEGTAGNKDWLAVVKEIFDKGASCCQ